MKCPAHFPFCFAEHTWIVTNRKGKMNRWEVLHRLNHKKNNWGYIHKDDLPVFSGITIFPYINKFYWPSSIVKVVNESKKYDLCAIFDFIEQSPYNYTNKNHYSLIGPNSNTYTNWILRNFSKISVTLPINAIG